MGRRKVCRTKGRRLIRAGPASLTKSEQTPSPNRNLSQEIQVKDNKTEYTWPPTWATQSVSIGF